MKYRLYPALGRTISVLGFGCMRFPADAEGKPCLLKSTRLLREAFRNGVNYYDTAQGYNGGESERILGHAVKPFRSQVTLSTKNPIRKDDTRQTWRERFDASVERLGGPPDILNFHFLAWDIFRTKGLPKRAGILAEARKAQAEGLFQHLALSSHDTPENMIKLLDTGEFVGITLQYNLLDRRNEKVMEHAYKKGLGVVVMGPVGGGRLGVPSERLQKMVRGGVRSTPEIALRFVLSNPNVTCAISGMNARRQLTENLAVADRRSQLSPAEKRQVADALRQIARLSDLYCTGCGYCMPCPHEVNISRNLQLLNLARVWGLLDYARRQYAAWKPGGKGGRPARFCRKCGRCQPRCPQKLDIIRELEEVERVLGGGTRDQ